MHHYNPYCFYGTFYNGGFQQFDGYCYSNITSNIPLPLPEEVPPEKPIVQPISKRSSRSVRTLTDIPTDSPSSRPSKSGINGVHPAAKSGTKWAQNQDPAYRFAPYSPVSTNQTPVTTTWKRNPKDFNLLVVPSSDEVAVSAVAINLRRPSEVAGSFSSSSASGAVPYTYPIPGDSVQVHSYSSTVSNRTGMTGPLALQKAQNPAAHSSGIGNYLLRKMGWSPGVGIGTRTHGGVTELLADQLEVKLNKKGLGSGAPNEATALGLASGGSVSAIPLPVAYLNDICADKGWKFPKYDLVLEDGPAHARAFKYSISLNGIQCVGDCGSTKKLAKANAARSCLQDLKL